MPAADAPILVTGATGFIASRIVEQLLASGRTVRGSVKSLKKVQDLAPLRGLPGAGTRLERAAWDFMRHGQPPFDLVAINPFLVIGPSLVPGLNTSTQVFVDLLKSTYPGIVALTWGFVDVRDVATAHIRAMETPSASGRYICAGETASMRTVVGLLRKHGWGDGYELPTIGLDNPVANLIVRLGSYLQPKGVGSYLRTHVGRVPRYDTSKIRRELGMLFRPLEHTIVDTMVDLQRWGH